MRAGWMLVVLVGCDGGKHTAGATYALSFDGVNSCATGDAEGLGVPSTLTVEAWVQASTEPAYGIHPILIFPGAFTLWSDENDVGWFTDGAAQDGASTNAGWMDGAVHHVAGVWDGEDAHLYVDGVLVGFGPATLFDEPGDQLFVGCWGSNARYHAGLLDELRVEAAVMYEDDFEPPTEAFEADENTIALWHFDEGDGDWAENQAGGLDLELEEVGWTEFVIGVDTVSAADTQ